MQLKRLMTPIILSAALALPALADCPSVSTDGRSLWVEQGANKRLVATDPNGIELPSWFGSRIAYARQRVDANSGARLTEVVVLKDSGENVRVITVPEDTTINGLLQLGWRDSKHVFIEGHVNPVTSLFLEYDVESGAITTERPGLLFAVSPNGRSIAQRQHVPMGTSDADNNSVLEVDGQAVYPAAGDGAHHVFVSDPAWARDSHELAIVEEVGGETALVVVSLDGRNVKINRLRLSLGGAEPKVSWSGDFVIVRTDQEALRIHPQTGKIEAATPADGASNDCN